MTPLGKCARTNYLRDDIVAIAMRLELETIRYQRVPGVDEDNKTTPSKPNGIRLSYRQREPADRDAKIPDHLHASGAQNYPKATAP